MQLTAPVKLLPTPAQASALRETLAAALAAAAAVSAYAWEHRCFGQWSLHHACYRRAREEFGLGAQLAVRVIGLVAQSYRADRRCLHRFAPSSAVPFDSRILRWDLARRQVSLWTLRGRVNIPFVCGERQLALLQGQRGESDLYCRGSDFYLSCACQVALPEPQAVEEYLGVDLGLVNIATDSDGTIYSGATVNGLRHRHRRLRQKLQAKGTKSARRLFKQRRHKETRFAADVNHCISKEIVATAQDTGRGLALEDLRGIRDRVTARQSQRATLSSWAFAQLGTFLRYKAALAGVPVAIVDPRNTSRTCPACGLVDKRNRKTQASFLCVRCGFSGLADHCAAREISRRGLVSGPYAAGLPA